MCAIKKISFSGESLLKNGVINGSKQVAVSESQNTKIVDSDKDKRLKAAMYVSSALALASIGIAGVAINKNFKSAKQSAKMISELSSNLEGKIETLTSQTKTMAENITNVASQAKSASEKLGKKVAAVENNANLTINKAREEINNVNYRIDSIPKPNFEVPGIYQTRKVNVFGLEMNLGTIVSEITGKVEEEMRNSLRMESTKRIFGMVKRPDVVPRFSIVRMPTSELVPFTKAGGMAVVPKDLSTNLAAIMETKSQNGAMILDTPLYIGQTAADNFLSKVAKISPETGKFEGQYEYIRTFLNDKGKWVKQKLATLNEVQEMIVPMHTEKGIIKEKVGVYISDVMDAPVDWDALRLRLSDETKAAIDKAISEGRKFETDFIRVEKNNITNEVEAFGKYRTVFYDSKKFDMSARKLNKGEKFNLYRNDTLSSGETERMTYFSKFFTEQLYNSEESKFVLKTLDKLDEKGNVILNKETNLPEKEYIKLGADAIIGNDWHTGPISAILRQLTTVKKYYGMDPQKAEKLQNLPIMTILHNVEYKGAVGFSQERMFNIMFGEHAAKIVENAFMPNVAVKEGAGLPEYLWNAMMTGREVNPQMMAASYSDVLLPVSEQYAKDIASHQGFGGSVHDIFKMRARQFEYADEDYVKSIMIKNNLDPKLVRSNKTMVGINNGCDTSNNTLTAEVAKKIESDLGLEQGSITPYSKDFNILEWHNKNKRVYLQEKLIKEVEQAKISNGENNPLKLYMPEATDLTGVSENTPVFALAGRIEDQKGIDIYSKGILEFYKNYKGSEYPIFYLQGIGANPKFMQYFLDAKKELAKTNPKAAQRMVAAGLFSEPGRYEGCKMITDFTPMTSWFEPFGLVHKEIAKFSGAVPITNEVGGLTANLTDELNALFVKYQHRFDPNIDAVKINGENFGKIIEKAVDIYQDKEKFGNMLKESLNADHGWLVPDGPIDKYANLLSELRVYN